MMESPYYYEDKPTKEIMQLAEESDAAACYILAKRYMVGTVILEQNENNAKYWYDKALSNIEHLNIDVIQYKEDVAIWLLENDNIEKAVVVANKISGNDGTAYYYELLFRKTGEEKYREMAIEKYKESLTMDPLQISDVVLQAFTDVELQDLTEICRINTFKCLAELANNSKQKRHFLVGALKENTVDTRERFSRVNDDVLNSFDHAYEERKNKGFISSIQDDSSEEMTDMSFSSIDYNERQFIYFAKDLKSLAGCYDESLPWVFTLDKYPKEIHFSTIGHPLPNTIYIAHPAKRGMYLPIEDAEEELFNDKVRDFRKLARCLGATKIEYHSIKGHSLSGSYLKAVNADIEGGFDRHDVSFGYDNKRSGSHYESVKGERDIVQKFNPTKTPYKPDDVAWLNIDSEWQYIVEDRMEGDLLDYEMHISSKKTMAVSDSRMDEVKLAYKSFIANAHVNYSQQMERSFQREEETEWKINVTFKPLDEFNPKFSENNQATGVLPKNEQKYIDNLNDFLEDDSEITSSERKMLDRIRQSLGVSEERAAELEASLKPQLTEDEQEYLEMYREYAEKGEITEKERRRLDKFADALGISEQRINEIIKF